jgi:very-short-patch-repair endonuclease
MTPENELQESVNQSQVRDRAVRLFTFLKELTELRSRTVRSYDQYDHMLWFHEIPRNHGCHCIAWRATPKDELSDVWVEVCQPRFKKVPDLPARLKGWIDVLQLENSTLQSPSLRDRIIVEKAAARRGDETPPPKTEIVQLVNEPDLPPLFKRYVDEKWQPWAEEDRKLRQVQQVYSDLFAIYQKQQRLGEAYEVVLGLGCLSWKLPSAQEVRRHLITCQVNLTFDAERGIISLGPAADGPRPVFEQDMLEPQERPDSIEQAAIEQQVQEIGDAIWDGVRVPTALKSWVQAVSPYGQYESSLNPPPTATLHPHVTLGAALILRRRTDQKFIKVYQEIIKQLKGGQEIPVGVRRLVSIVDDRDYRSSDEESGSSPGAVRAHTPGEVYFPLPANNEQRQIVTALSSRQGVLVQGPPGTGKSHTITNLVCHLLAIGKRVLITSHTQRALRVLLEKFEHENHLKEIARLCVILLGDDLDSRKALEDSVQSVLDHLNHWDERESRQKINRLERELEQRRRDETSAMNSLRAARETETYRHESVFGSYSGTAREIAMRVRAEKDRYQWLPSYPEPDQAPPLTDDEAIALLHLLRSMSPDAERDLRKIALSLDGLPSPSEFKALIKEEATCKAKYDEAETRRAHPAYEGFAKLAPEGRRNVLEHLARLAAGFEGLSRHIHNWASAAATQILGERDRAWRELLATTKKHLSQIEQRHRIVANRTITGFEEREYPTVRDHAAELRAHLSVGGSLGFWVFQHKTVRKCRFIIEEIKVDGQPCDNVESLDVLLKWTDILECLSELQTLWTSHTTAPTGSLQIKIAEYHDLCEPIEAGLELLAQVRLLKETFAKWPGFYQPAWHKLEEIRGLVEVGHSVHATESLGVVRKGLTALEERVSSQASAPTAHPTSKDFLEAVRARDAEQYEIAYAAIQNLTKKQAELEHRYYLLNKLRSDAPLLAKNLASQYDDPVWEERVATLSLAWNWARASRWIEQLSDPAVYRRLTYSLDASRKRIEELLGLLASEKAWGFCIARIREPQRQHLVAWRKAVERVGKGKGKASYVAKNREEARHHMQECRVAIPAWIMPIYRVAESFMPGKDAFDVVIVDEASQSGPEALFLQYLAKQIIVVGDDKQISPDNVGLNKQDVDLLRERNIKDLPHNDSLGIEHSFFDQADLRYGGRIRLREHFRCMPEIIQFSNNLCYASQPLISLRQFGSGRLQPVLVTKYVETGYQRGHPPRVDNPSEAEAIARQIKHCCDDPAYQGKTLGVISLLGENQARLIEKHLLNLVGPSEMKKRDLICGDAYAFQGDERDIIFLSLVSAPAEAKRISTLASPKDVKRFNVATSRARDQMWLVHSATLNDLSPQCLRYQLLSYFLHPQVRPSAIEGVSLEDLRAASLRADRKNDSPPSPFDSWFEVDVFLRISDRGYRVIPQFEVAGYYIDLVVEGMKGRIAVECDGDECHGLEQFDNDMARQRMLERCGWNFSRIRASSYYRDEEAALVDLWDLLKQKNIHPASVEQSPAPGPPSESQSAPKAPSTIENSIGEVSGQLPNHSEFPPEPLEEGFSWLTSNKPAIEKTFSPASKSVADGPYEPFGPGPISVPGTWFKMSHWGKVSQKLNGYLNRFAYDIGRRLARHGQFSEKQSKLVQQTWREALSRGFDPTDERNGSTSE